MMMKTFTRLVYAGIAALLASGCYCERHSGGSSSVRFLRGYHSHSICHDLPGRKNGKKVLATVYTGDPHWQRMDFQRQHSAGFSQITYRQQLMLGIRMESFFRLGAFPGPLLGVGPDYSYNRMQTSYSSFHFAKQERSLEQHRLNLGLSFVTWIRPRMIGYIGLQPGYQWSTTITSAESMPVNAVTEKKEGFNWRVSYGFQFYVHPLIALNLEAGYGAGAFVRAGIGVWIF